MSLTQSDTGHNSLSTVSSLSVLSVLEQESQTGRPPWFQVPAIQEFVFLPLVWQLLGGIKW